MCGILPKRLSGRSVITLFRCRQVPFMLSCHIFRYCPSMPTGENASIPPTPQNAGYHRECYQRYTCKSKIDRQRVLEQKRQGIYRNACTFGHRNSSGIMFLSLQTIIL